MLSRVYVRRDIKLTLPLAEIPNVDRSTVRHSPGRTATRCHKIIFSLGKLLVAKHTTNLNYKYSNTTRTNKVVPGTKRLSEVC
jgi:hypothetical protein